MFQGFIFAVISASAFASLAVLVKLGYDAGLDGAAMMQCRFTFGALILGVALFIKDRSLLRISRTGLLHCAILGMVIYWLQSTCFVKALTTIPASTTALVLYGHPVLVALLSKMFLGMRLDRTVIFSLIMVVSGCCLVFYDAFLREVEATGLLYAFGAMTFFSGYLVLSQVWLKGLKPLTATFWVMVFAAVAFNISGEASAWIHPTGPSMAIGLTLGLLPGMIALSLLFLAIEKIGSSWTCIFSSIEPVVTLGLAAIILDETVVPLQMGGAALIVLGIVIPNVRIAMLRGRTGE
ncbi:DMT family transporter [Pseudodesulfovibrio sp.]|uniref:DMT family transporter n=1 Tax=unclassified Pseudodesulfovibrio TaxID=2661612 RepID=UPI003B00D9A4